MIRQGRERLLGRVEVDEAYMGGKREGPAGRGAEGKTLVLIAVEGESGHKLGRVRLRCIETITKEAAESFIQDYVEPGSNIVTDGLNAYHGLGALGYAHNRNVVSTGGDETLAPLDHVHWVISLVQRWLDGTDHGAVKPSHLQAYLNEFAFRSNRRLSTHRGMLFYRLVQQAVTARPPSTKEFYGLQIQDVGGA